MPVTNTEHTDTLPTRRDRRHTIHENIHARESWKLLEPPVCASRFGALPEHPSVQPGSVRAAMISPRCHAPAYTALKASHVAASVIHNPPTVRTILTHTRTLTRSPRPLPHRIQLRRKAAKRSVRHARCGTHDARPCAAPAGVMQPAYASPPTRRRTGIVSNHAQSASSSVSSVLIRLSTNGSA
jgi:hypothetical protein